MTLPNDSPDVPLLGDPPLSPEAWRHVRALVDETLALPQAARAAFLAASCGGDAALRDRVTRLVAANERAESSWGFLAHPAAELVAPLLAANDTLMEGLPAAFHAALAERYAVGAELGRGGMATVYAAQDLRHQRRVAIKVLDPHLGASLGSERFLSEIRVTAGLQHPNLLPLFDSGEAGGLLYYVMPLIEGATLRARLQRERQLPVEEALRIVSAVAGALDYAHRQGVVHRDLKPENILLQDGHPLVADFGIALAVARAGVTHRTAPGISLGTPQYMSPEQAAGDGAVDARSDIYSLACVLYELLSGDPPFTGSTKQAIIARVLADAPSSVRTVRPNVPEHVEAALARALSKRPADRQATAREFAEALVTPTWSTAGRPGHAARRRTAIRAALGAVATIGVAAAAWTWSARRANAPTEPTLISYKNLIDQSLTSSVTITPNGRALVYTGSVEAGRPIMIWRLDQRAARSIPGTEGGSSPYVSPDGRHLAYMSVDDRLANLTMDGVAASNAAKAWRYGNGGWVGDSAILSGGPSRGLYARALAGGAAIPFTWPDSARGETRHVAPLLIPGTRAVVFTVSTRYRPGLAPGPLAIATLDPGGLRAPHVLLGVTGRRAIAFVDGWLLYTSADGKAILAVRLDLVQRRTFGAPVSVLRDDAGNLETAALADNGTLLYVRRPHENSALFVDPSGTQRSALANAEGPFMYPRFSPDGKRFAIQVTTAKGEDLWLYDLATRTPTRLTTTGRALHPTWTPDGRRIVFMTGPSELMSMPVDGSGAATTVPGTRGGFAPNVTPDGKTVVFQVHSDSGPWNVWSAALNGDGAARKVIDDRFVDWMPAISPDGHWLAYASTMSGRNEVYVRAFPGPGRAVQVSDSGGKEPVWSSDGHRVYYRVKDAVMAAVVRTSPLVITSRTRQFSGAFDETMPHRNYDVSSDGTTFLMIAPFTAATPEAVLVLKWLSTLREQLAREPALRDPVARGR